MIEIKFIVALLTLIIGSVYTRKEIKALFSCMRQEIRYIEITDSTL